MQCWPVCSPVHFPVLSSANQCECKYVNEVSSAEQCALQWCPLRAQQWCQVHSQCVSQCCLVLSSAEQSGCKYVNNVSSADQCALCITAEHALKCWPVCCAMLASAFQYKPDYINFCLISWIYIFKVWSLHGRYDDTVLAASNIFILFITSNTIQKIKMAGISRLFVMLWAKSYVSYCKKNVKFWGRGWESNHTDDIFQPMH